MGFFFRVNMFFGGCKYSIVNGTPLIQTGGCEHDQSGNIRLGARGLVRDDNGNQVDGWVRNQADSAGGVSVKYSVRNYGEKPVRKYSVYYYPADGAPMTT